MYFRDGEGVYGVYVVGMAKGGHLGAPAECVEGGQLTALVVVMMTCHYHTAQPWSLR